MPAADTRRIIFPEILRGSRGAAVAGAEPPERAGS